MTAATDGTDAQGKPIHTEITHKVDNSEYDIKGAPDPKSTRFYTRIGDNTYQYVNKVNGNITTTVHVQVSADGKTRTIITTGRDAQGRGDRQPHVVGQAVGWSGERRGLRRAPLDRFACD